jgi:hypothetical protein
MKHVALIIFILLAIMTEPNNADHQVHSHAGYAPQNQVGGSLPRCVEGTEVTDIQNTVSANSKTDYKYDGYRRALHSASPEELVARLAYAETLAANCPQFNEKIAPKIVNTITNRARIRGDVASVVFQRDQFASSFNNYSQSRFRDLLCPRDIRLWSQVYQEARRALSGSPSGGLPANGVNYYLYQHNQSFAVPAFASGRGLFGDQYFSSCVRFFANPFR